VDSSSELYTRALNVVQEARHTIQQAQASGNVQQVYEAQRRLYLAQQEIEHVQSLLKEKAGARESHQGHQSRDLEE
jgi:hypothetical protein